MKLVVLWVAIIAASLGVAAQPVRESLASKPISMELANAPFATVIRHLVERYDIRIGFEESALDSRHNDYDFEVGQPAVGQRNITNESGSVKISIEAERDFNPKSHRVSVKADKLPLSAFLSILTEQMGDYDWRITDEVVNIFPKSHQDPEVKQLLDVKIREFSSIRGSTVGHVTKTVRKLPEVTAFFNETRLYYNDRKVGAVITLQDQLNQTMNADISIRNVPLRDLLNRIVLVKGGGWIVRKSHSFGSPQKVYIDVIL